MWTHVEQALFCCQGYVSRTHLGRQGAELWMASVLEVYSLKNIVCKISIPFRIMWIKTILALLLLVTWIDCAPLDVHGCDSCNTGKNIYPKYYRHWYILWHTQLIGNVLSYSDLKKYTSKHKLSFLTFMLINFFTDRKFVAKYSRQVLHFDHEVTY
jgi:hypothetical protein